MMIIMIKITNENVHQDALNVKELGIYQLTSIFQSM